MVKQLIEQLTKYFHAESENKPAEKKQFFKLLAVKIFEYTINDKDVSELYEDLKKELIENKVKEFNELQRSFDTISNILF